MSARKAKVPRTHEEFRGVVPPPPRKKTRAARVRLTHFEVRRGEALRLRIAVADDALAEVGDELGALIKRIAPSTRTTIVRPVAVAVPVATEPVAEPAVTAHPVVENDFLVSRAHVEHDTNYHAELREHLAGLFSTLCDTSLEDALDCARKERDRRAEGAN